VYIKPPNEVHRAIVVGEEEEWELIVRLNFPVEGPIAIPADDPECQARCHTGWHRHPGRVLIQLVKDAVRVYEADDPSCTSIVVDSGEAYVDLSEHAHIRSEPRARR
jgi:hypothetical protein